MWKKLKASALAIAVEEPGRDPNRSRSGAPPACRRRRSTAAGVISRRDRSPAVVAATGQDADHEALAMDRGGIRRRRFPARRAQTTQWRPVMAMTFCPCSSGCTAPNSHRTSRGSTAMSTFRWKTSPSGLGQSLEATAPPRPPALRDLDHVRRPEAPAGAQQETAPRRDAVGALASVDDSARSIRAGARSGSGTRAAGHSSPPRWRATAAATWRPSSAATSAVSAPWSTLPAAKTPGRVVRRPASTAGPFVSGSSSIPASHGELVVGDPVGGEDDQVALDARASRRCRGR